jgi:hypothetical protein
MKFLYLILIILSSFTSAIAQKVYGLKDCIGIGLERNFSLLVAKNSETIIIQLAMPVICQRLILAVVTAER